MRCPHCGEEDFAFTEETRRMTLWDKFLTAALIIVGVILTVVIKSSIGVLIGAALIGIALIFEFVIIYLQHRTSRTKVICKHCFHWWYLKKN